MEVLKCTHDLIHITEFALNQLLHINRSFHKGYFIVLPGNVPGIFYAKEEDIHLLPLETKLKTFNFKCFFDEYLKKEYFFFDLRLGVFKLKVTPKSDTPSQSFSIDYTQNQFAITSGKEIIILFEKISKLSDVEDEINKFVINLLEKKGLKLKKVEVFRQKEKVEGKYFSFIFDKILMK